MLNITHLSQQSLNVNDFDNINDYENDNAKDEISEVCQLESHHHHHNVTGSTQSAPNTITIVKAKYM